MLLILLAARAITAMTAIPNLGLEEFLEPPLSLSEQDGGSAESRSRVAVADVGIASSPSWPSTPVPSNERDVAPLAPRVSPQPKNPTAGFAVR